MNTRKLPLRNIVALNNVQRDLLETEENTIVHGSAGTGKTFLLMYKGLLLVRAGVYDKIVIIRSAVATRQIGFLPGGESDKSKVYEAPYESICTDLFGQKGAYNILKTNKSLEFKTSSFVRGITLEDCFVIVDEFQNMDFHELDSIMTRVGDNCKINFSGDMQSQSDLCRNAPNEGLQKFVSIVKQLKTFDIIRFTAKDVVRSGLVKEYLLAKEKYESGNDNK